METLPIGQTGLNASRIALGSWAIGGWMWGGSEESEAIAAVHAALDHGINLIDTAPVYGFGYSEEIIGKALAGRRERALIATKVGLDWRDGKAMRNSTPQRLRQELEDSLRRLGTDYIDLYQIHWPDPRVPIEETAEMMAEFLREGRIRAIGVSNFSPEQMMAFSSVAPLHAVQPPYNLFERTIEADVLPYARQRDLAVLAYGALCRGLLTGTVTASRRFAGDDLRNHDPKFRPPRLEQYLAAVDALAQFARARYGESISALAVRWILDQGPTVALWGARRADQLSTVGEAMGWSLDAEALAEIDRILTACITDPAGPEFMAPPARVA